MRKKMGELSRIELSVLARIRLSITAGLCVLVGNEGGAELSPKGSTFSLAMSARRLRGPRILCSQGLLALEYPDEATTFRLPPSLSLDFGPPVKAIRILSGGPGRPMALPAALSAPAAGRWFARAAAEAARALSSDSTETSFRARLLAEAALRGIIEVGNWDPWVAERLGHAPEGTIGVECPGSFSLALERTEDGRLRLRSGNGEAGKALLSFKDPRAAVTVLSGRRAAVLALASGEVRIGGFVPLVQALFAVLDRLGEYLSVETGEEGAA